MGTLRYGAAQRELRIEDATLAHLQTVITTKLRRSEGMLLTWHDGTKGAAWIHPQCDVTYEYEHDEEVALDSDRLDRMMAEASGTRGLRVELHGGKPVHAVTGTDG